MSTTAAPEGFTGERLHRGAGDDEEGDLFAADLARHEAAYRFAVRRLGGAAATASRRGLDLGSGSGYGVAILAELGRPVLAIDRVPPDPHWRDCGRFLCADLYALPLAPRSCDWVVSFQVIEHLADPDPYLAGIARVLRPGGQALLSTPNRLTSDGSNPFHVHEYEAAELAALLEPHFTEVEMLGIGASGAAQRFLDERQRRVARILRLDPFGLRRLLPGPLVARLYGLFAKRVRRAIRRQPGGSRLDWRDFPIGPVGSASIDLLALCGRGPG